MPMIQCENAVAASCQTDISVLVMQIIKDKRVPK